MAREVLMEVPHRREPTIISKRPNYMRCVATKEVSRFCGWEYLNDILTQVPEVVELRNNRQMKKIEKWENLKRLRGGKNPPGRPPKPLEHWADDIKLHEASIVIFFKVGSRAREILGLQDPENPDEWISPPLTTDYFIFDDPEYVYVQDVPVLKRYKAKDYVELREENPVIAPSQIGLWHYNEKTDLFERKKWLTVRLEEKRTFQFPKDEPWSDLLFKWVQELKRRGEKRILLGDYEYWYRFLRDLDPMKEKYGSRVTWRHLYCHWFRAQRASQLANDYRYSINEIASWGAWKTLDTVREYVAVEGPMLEKMSEAKPTWRQGES